MHPTLSIKATKGESLVGKNIILGVTGSIAAIETIKLARELIRRGADVYAVMSDSARKIIHPYALHYATGHEVITEITGEVEHISLENADLLLIAPCTANTISKIAQGIDDTPVTTFATVALGSNVRVMIAPAMHGSMYEHPIVKENTSKLSELGVDFVGPSRDENAAKMALIEDMILEVERALSPSILESKKILITSGATKETIDPIRVITNRSSGITGRELAKEAFRQGAEVTIVHSKKFGIHGIKEISVESTDEMIDAVLEELRDDLYDMLISAAAIMDFTVSSEVDKIKSGCDRHLTLTPTRKLIKEVREIYPNLKIIGFKAETNVSNEELIRRARDFMESLGMEMVIANDVARGGMGTVDNEVFILDHEVKHVKGLKKDIAKEIIRVVGSVG